MQKSHELVLNYRIFRIYSTSGQIRQNRNTSCGQSYGLVSKPYGVVSVNFAQVYVSIDMKQVLKCNFSRAQIAKTRAVRPEVKWTLIFEQEWEEFFRGGWRIFFFFSYASNTCFNSLTKENCSSIWLLFLKVLIKVLFGVEVWKLFVTLLFVGLAVTVNDSVLDGMESI